MGLVELPTNGPFNLADTLSSGQVFHWEKSKFKERDGFAACISGGSVSWVSQPDPNTILTLSNDAEKVKGYLGLDHDLVALRASYPSGDVFLEQAINYCPGIRIIRQPVWECLATFITSSLKQVAHIRSISLTLRQRFGNECSFENIGGFYEYPTPEALVAAGEDQLRECALGYRAKSLHLAALAIAEGRINLAAVENEPDIDVAREELMQLHGVGEKIANCVLLFGCGRWGTFPIDVWIERVLRQKYRKRVKGAKLQQWAEDYFGPNAGYAQQYLFHFARHTL